MITTSFDKGRGRRRRRGAICLVSLATTVGVAFTGVGANAWGANPAPGVTADPAGSTTSAQFKVDLMRRIFTEFGATGDVGALTSHMTADVTYQVTIPPGTPISGVFQGKEGVRRYFQVLPTVVTHLGLNVTGFYAAGDKAFVTGNETLLVLKSGEIFTTDWVIVATFRGKRISKVVVVENLSPISAAYGVTS